MSYWPWPQMIKWSVDKSIFIWEGIQRIQFWTLIKTLAWLVGCGEALVTNCVSVVIKCEDPLNLSFSMWTPQSVWSVWLIHISISQGLCDACSTDTVPQQPSALSTAAEAYDLLEISQSSMTFRVLVIQHLSSQETTAAPDWNHTPFLSPLIPRVHLTSKLSQPTHPKRQAITGSRPIDECRSIVGPFHCVVEVSCNRQ